MTDKRINYLNVGRCLYCGSLENLSREHVIPASLGGLAVLQDASCRVCAEITAQFEQDCARSVFGQLRIVQGLRSRRKRDRPKTLEVLVRRGETTESIQVTPEEHPGAIVSVPILPRSGVRSDRPYPNIVYPTQTWHGQCAYDNRRDKLLKKYGADELLIPSNVRPYSFLRLLAKIAHCTAAGEYGLDNFLPILPDYILGRSVNLLHYVGGYEGTTEAGTQHNWSEGEGATPEHIVKIGLPELWGVKYVGCRIYLYQSFPMPGYEVIVGYPRAAIWSY